MASLLSGYEYDIFVSYRQKDNKYDGWVTEFVANLKKELEATFKEDVSIYFDENPHDGLLETHQVDKSLEGKLKCLVLIPILSRTYCDPSSFAWQNEFLPFRDLAKADAFGLDIRLANKNVASRILPLQIHDLNPEDQELFEKETGGALRSITFIFKSQGVNRPLTSEDGRNDNANRTLYRDQINKTANAIEEIIGAMCHTTPAAPRAEVLSATPSQIQVHGVKWFWSELIRRNVLRAGFAYIIAALAARQVATVLTDIFELREQIPNILTWVLISIFPFGMLLAWLYEVSPQGVIRTTSRHASENPYKPSQKKPLTGTIIIAILSVSIIVLFLYIYFVQSKSPPERNEKSIAVLPFENRSENTNDSYLSDGFTDDIINRLYMVGNLRVISRASSSHYKKSEKSIKEIAQELEVATILTGSVQRAGNILKITVQLQDGSNDELIWGEIYQRMSTDVLSVQAEITRQVASVLKIKIDEHAEAKLNKRPTENLTAYDHFLKGRSLYNYSNADSMDRAIDHYKMAIVLDPNYALAYAGLADAYAQLHSRFARGLNWLDSSIVAGNKSVKLDSSASDGYKALGAAFSYARQYGTAFNYHKKAVEKNRYNAQAIGNLGAAYFLRLDYAEAIRLHKLSAGLNPRSAVPFQSVGWIYRLLGDLPQAESWLKKSLDRNPGLWDTYRELGFTYCSQGRNSEAIKLIPKMLESGERNTRRLEIAGRIAHFAGDNKSAKTYFQESIQKNLSYKNDPNSLSAIGLGQILTQEGNSIEAEIYLSHGLELYHNEISNGSPDDDPPFNLSAIYAIQRKRTESLHWLQKAIDMKWIDYAQVEYGPYFVPYREDPDFKSTLSVVRQKVAAIREEVERH